MPLQIVEAHSLPAEVVHQRLDEATAAGKVKIPITWSTPTVGMFAKRLPFTGQITGVIKIEPAQLVVDLHVADPAYDQDVRDFLQPRIRAALDAPYTAPPAALAPVAPAGPPSPLGEPAPELPPDAQTTAPPRAPAPAPRRSRKKPPPQAQPPAQVQEQRPMAGEDSVDDYSGDYGSSGGGDGYGAPTEGYGGIGEAPAAPPASSGGPPEPYYPPGNVSQYYQKPSYNLGLDTGRFNETLQSGGIYSPSTPPGAESLGLDTSALEETAREGGVIEETPGAPDPFNLDTSGLDKLQTQGSQMADQATEFEPYSDRQRTPDFAALDKAAGGINTAQAVASIAGAAIKAGAQLGTAAIQAQNRGPAAPYFPGARPEQKAPPPAPTNAAPPPGYRPAPPSRTPAAGPYEDPYEDPYAAGPLTGAQGPAGPVPPGAAPRQAPAPAVQARPQAAPQSAEGLSTGAIVAAAVGGVVLLGGAAVAVWAATRDDKDGKSKGKASLFPRSA